MPELEREAIAVKETANDIRGLIDIKQLEFQETGRLYAFNDLFELLNDSKYKKMISSEQRTIKLQTEQKLYRWEYRDLVVADGRPAILIEKAK